MVCCCCKSSIGDYLPPSFVDDAPMRYPVLTIPQQMIGRDVLDRHQALVGEHHLALCDAGELGLLALLPQVPVLPVLGDLAVEHA